MYLTLGAVWDCRHGGRLINHNSCVLKFLTFICFFVSYLTGSTGAGASAPNNDKLLAMLLLEVVILAEKECDIIDVFMTRQNYKCPRQRAYSHILITTL